MYKFFYVSYPVIDLLVDENNPNHLMLIERMREINSLENVILTKYECNKIRNLMKKAGLVDEYGNTGRVGKYDIDLSLRQCKYPNINDNFEGEITCEWIDF